jgi:hypothetical protein
MVMRERKDMQDIRNISLSSESFLFHIFATTFNAKARTFTYYWERSQRLVAQKTEGATCLDINGRSQWSDRQKERPMEGCSGMSQLKVTCNRSEEV